MIPGFLFIVLCMFGSNPFACVAIIIIASAFNGAVTTTSQQNIHDLAPNYAGTLSGIINCAGVATGLISPILVAYFTKDGVSSLNPCFDFLYLKENLFRAL